MTATSSTPREPDTSSRERRVRAVPSVPYALPLVGHTVAFARDPDAFIRRNKARLGSVFRVRMIGGERTFLLDPFDYPTVFAEERLRFQESGAEIGGRVFGYPAERAMGEPAHDISHVSGRDLRGDLLQDVSETMQRYFVERMARDVGRATIERPLLALLCDHFFSAGIDAIFGEGFATDEVYADYARIDRFFGAAVTGVPPRFLPGFVAARDRLARTLGHRGPRYAPVLDARDEVFGKYGIEPALSSRFDAGLLWASQANTVVTAFWTVVYLLRNAQALTAIRAELHDVVGSATLASAEPLSRDALRRLVLLDSACSEGMRLAAGPMNGRHATEDFELPLDSGGVIEVRAGQDFLLYPRDTHLDPEIFPDPAAFRFDRFVDDRGRAAWFSKGERRLTMPFLPFGGGVSMCPGRFFARNEIKVLVATLMSWLDTELVDRELPPLDFSRIGLGTLPPTKDVVVRVRAR